MECTTSTVKLLGFRALTSVMVGMCYFLTTMPDLFSRVVGWIGVGFFGLGFIVFPILLLRTGAQVVIDDRGIEDRRMKCGVIRWEDIRSLSIGPGSSSEFLCVEVADPEKYLSRLSGWRRRFAAANEAMGFPALTIGFTGLRPGLKEVWAYLQSQDPLRYGRTPPDREPRSRVERGGRAGGKRSQRPDERIPESPSPAPRTSRPSSRASAS